VALQLAAHGGMGQMFEAVVFGSADLLELLAAGNQFGQLALGQAGRGGCGGLEAPPEVGQDRGIEAVGFGEMALGAREIAHVTGIDDSDGESGGLEGGAGGAFIAAGGFTDDLERTERAQPTQQGALAGSVIGELPHLWARRTWDMQVEGGFGDIHSDIDEGR